MKKAFHCSFYKSFNLLKSNIPGDQETNLFRLFCDMKMPAIRICEQEKKDISKDVKCHADIHRSYPHNLGNWEYIYITESRGEFYHWPTSGPWQWPLKCHFTNDEQALGCGDVMDGRGRNEGAQQIDQLPTEQRRRSLTPIKRAAKLEVKLLLELICVSSVGKW